MNNVGMLNFGQDVEFAGQELGGELLGDGAGVDDLAGDSLVAPRERKRPQIHFAVGAVP